MPTDDAEALAAVLVEGGDLCAAGEIALAFTVQGQLFAFELELSAGGVLDLETRGDDPVDPVLTLYRPDASGSGFESEAAASDDDGGDGLHARLAAVAIDRGGPWLVGVTSRGGTSLGAFVLAASAAGTSLCAEEAEICCLVDPSAGAVAAVYDTRSEGACTEGGGIAVSAALCNSEIGCCEFDEAVGEVVISACAQAGGAVVQSEECGDFDPDEQLCCKLGGLSEPLKFVDCVTSFGQPSEGVCDDEDHPGDDGTGDEGPREDQG